MNKHSIKLAWQSPVVAHFCPPKPQWNNLCPTLNILHCCEINLDTLQLALQSYKYISDHYVNEPCQSSPCKIQIKVTTHWPYAQRKANSSHLSAKPQPT